MTAERLQTHQENPTSNAIIETVTFKLNEGVSHDAFVAPVKGMNALVAARPGFVHCRLSCTEDSTWIEHIQRQDMPSAKAAENGKAPGNANFLSAIDGKIVQLMHRELEVAIN